MAEHNPRRRRRRKTSRRLKVRRPRARPPARRARRRVRRNPRSPLQMPAVQFAGAAGLGAGIGLAVESSGILGDKYGTPGMRAAVVAALVALASNFMLKGKSRQYGFAAAAGVLIPPAATAIATTLAPMLGGPQTETAALRRRLGTKTRRSVSAPRMSVQQNAAQAQARAVRANLIH